MVVAYWTVMQGKTEILAKPAVQSSRVITPCHNFREVNKQIMVFF